MIRAVRATERDMQQPQEEVGSKGCAALPPLTKATQPCHPYAPEAPQTLTNPVARVLASLSRLERTPRAVSLSVRRRQVASVTVKACRKLWNGWSLRDTFLRRSL